MKFKLFLVAFFLNVYGFSQQWQGASSSALPIYRDGEFSSVKSGPYRINIGSLWGNPSLDWTYGYIGFNFARTTLNPTAPWEYYGDGASNGSAAIFGNVAGHLYFSVTPSTGGNGGSLSDSSVLNTIKMRLQNDGKLIIGDSPIGGSSNILSPGNYRLYVQNGILTERVKVAVRTGSDWSDYVFDKKYSLMPLKTLQQYIDKHKHLPGIPTSEEMVKEGNDLGATDAKLLAKIEELTLYILDLNKKLEEQKVEIGEMKKRLTNKN
ncbi:MAG: hypothetical protein K2Q24_07270 [Chitinophagaceae bacterium]|nr:hypothetical protein [Chitinophagaceae bacterium]